MTRIKKLTTTSDGMLNDITTLENCRAVSYKVNIHFIIWPSNPTANKVCTREVKCLSTNNLHINVNCNFTHNGKKLETNVHQQLDKKSEYTYSIEYLVKRKKGMEQTNHTQDLKSILNNNRTQAATYCVIPFIWSLSTDKTNQQWLKSYQ